MTIKNRKFRFCEICEDEAKWNQRIDNAQNAAKASTIKRGSRKPAPPNVPGYGLIG